MKLCIAALLAAALHGQPLRLGEKVGDFRFATVQGAPVKFSSLQGGTTVVLFVSTKCPISADYNERMKSLYQEYSAKGVKFVFLNANQNEPASEVAQHARDHAFPFPVYKDENNVAADLFGAQFTPETYVIDQEGVLRYHGRIDDSRNEARVHNRDLRNAIDAVMARKPVPMTETKAFGCTIKRARKTAS